jgi:hypothetical protein
MFYIRKRSIKYFETSRGIAYTAHLLEKGSDVHLGMVENRGVGGMTTFGAANPHVHNVVKTFAEKLGTDVETLMETYMDLAEGQEPKDKELATKLANY